jgi:RHS repeat-associated protein
MAFIVPMASSRPPGPISVQEAHRGIQADALKVIESQTVDRRINQTQQLHGTGLPDVIYSRLQTKNGKTTLVSGAYRNTGRGWVPEPGQCTIDSFDISNPNPALSGGLCPAIPFAGDDISGNPVQFVDLDGDGYLDLIYSYQNKAGVIVTKVYFNVDDGHGGRRWSDRSPDPSGQKTYAPPDAIFPLASFGIGDMGVRFAKFDTNRLGVLRSFRAAGSIECTGFPPRCALKPGPTTRGAFAFDGTHWIDRSPLFGPPVPFVTQLDSATGVSLDLFVQVIDITGAGLPAIVANFTDPITGAVTNKVWLNTEGGWDASNAIAVPYALDALYREPKTLVQFADVNGDGLPDIVMTKGGCSDCSRTWVNTGRGWIENAAWRIPNEAIGSKDGDPGFRLVDTKGDGYLDVLWMRQKDDKTFEQGLRLNNGHDWATQASGDVAPKDLAFIDKDGVDQGVRLLSVSGKGLTDIVQSFEGRLQTVQLNRSRRADVLNAVTDGYGLKTSIYYQTLLEVDGADESSGVPEGIPLGWRTYEREAADAYPKVAPVPTTYVVRRAIVDETNGHPSVVDYRYGKYRVDGAALRSLGFGWRETLNEFSNVLTRSEMIQDARARPGINREATCIVKQDVLKNLVKGRPASDLVPEAFPNDLCPSGDATVYSWGHKVSENINCWTVSEGDLNGGVNETHFPASGECGADAQPIALTGFIIRQSAITKSRSTTYELDGRVVSSSTNTLTYDADGGSFNRFGNLLASTSLLADGTSINTANEYSDDPSRWFLGRLTKTTVTKYGDLLQPGGSQRKSETRQSCFEYYPDTGLLAAQEVNCGSPRAVTTRFERDALGNITSKVTTAAGEPQQATRSEFDEFGRFEIATIDVLGHRAMLLRDVATGQPLSITGPNNFTELFEYDTFGRLRKHTDPAGTATSSNLIAPSPGVFPKVDSVSDISSGLSVSVNYAITTQTGSLPPNWTLFDIKGRAIRKVSQGFSADASKARLVFQETEYDALGRVTRSSVPHYADEPSRWTVSEYDDLGRVCASTAINGLRTETIFEGLAGGGARVIVAVDPKEQLVDVEPGPPTERILACGHGTDPSVYRTNGLDQRTYSTINMRKLVVESSDTVGRVTYEYDPGGRLEAMIGPTGAVTHNTYDELGNKIIVSDPDLGVWRYDYDPFGRVVRQIDAKGQRSTMEYDVADRPTRRVLNDTSTVWEYDTAKHGVGKVASVTNSNGYKESYFYDSYGRMISHAVLIDGEQYTTSTEYDELGRVRTLSYPSAFTVENVYDARGFFTSVRNSADGEVYWTAKDIDALGRVTEESFGNGVATIKRFDHSDERVRQIQSSERSGKRFLDLMLEYDLAGNLKSRKEAVEGKNERFEYDQINRLVAQVSAGSGRSEYRYDAAGRMTFKSDVGDYHYGVQGEAGHGTDPIPFHAVTATSGNETPYKHDLNGNLVSWRAGHFDYTADNHARLMYLDEARWSRFDYGPSGNRFRQFLRDGTLSEETLYAGLYEKITDYSPYLNFDVIRSERFSGFERLTRGRNYLVNGSGVFAFVETDDMLSNTQFFEPDKPATHWYGKLTSRETWYLHADQLGSILRITDQDGRVRKGYWYDPWGARSERNADFPGSGETQRLGNSWKRGFTGQEHLDAFFLIHMNGRVYNPTLAAFTSVDPVNQMIFDSQAGNGYAYTRDNPLRYIDPNGFSLLGDAWEGVKHAVGGAGTAIWHGVTHFGGEAGKWFAENWRVVVVVAVVIVVTVVTLGSGTPEAVTLGDAILAGAAAGAAGGATSAALYGGSPTDIIEAAIKGGVIGAFSGAAFYGVGQFFGSAEEMSTSSQIESMAAHGVVGGAKEAVEGGDFWRGFIATAATKASSLYGPEFHDVAADTARAAVVGGTVALLNGGKFANGAITGAFSYAFNDLLHEYGSWSQGGFGYHQRLVVTDETGTPIENFSFGTNNPFTWPVSSLSGNNTPVPNGSGTGEIYEEDLDEPGIRGKIIETFKTTEDENQAIATYMSGRIGEAGRYSIFTNSCISFCNQQYNYIRSQIMRSRAEYHSPVLAR